MLTESEQDSVDKNTSVKTSHKQDEEVSNANNKRKRKSTSGGLKQRHPTGWECSAVRPRTRRAACTPDHLCERSTEVICDYSKSSTTGIDERTFGRDEELVKGGLKQEHAFAPAKCSRK